MRFGSVCSGIEAASVAWEPLGWKAARFSEIEPFPCAVLAHHYPSVPNLGDMTTLPNKILEGEVEAPDVFCGGTPCQAFSVAGKRQSLDDARGNLSLVFCEIANAIDDVRGSAGQQPTIVFWENVPGVLSTKDNAFGCFLGELTGEDCAIEPPRGKWTNAGCVYGPKRTVAWRVLDAQYFGVAQRRRRVFVVASARTDIDPAAILFEFEGLRRDTAPSREARQVAPTIPSRSTGGGGLGTDFDCDGGLQPVAKCLITKTRLDSETETLIPTYGIPGNWIGRKPENGGNSVEPMHDVAPCLTKSDRHGVAQPVCIHGTQDPCVSTETAFAIGRNSGQENAVVQPVAAFKGGQGSGAGGIGYSEHVAPTLPASDGGNRTPTLLNGMAVRRLTPVECERLQGFPDGYTAIPWRKKEASECPDGPRYKALGNSWAVPNVRWIGQRIQLAIEVAA